MEEKKTYPVVASGYKILEEVGQGVSATVYRAMCLPFSEIVAIKSLDLEKCNSNLDEIRREAQTMSLISHANVVKAHCSFVVDQSLWVVMPYMSGGSCLHIMKAAHPDGFEEAVIATVLRETLKALEYLHRHGHIHRDVKAGNILVDSNGSVKLGDFGVSACMFDTGDRQRSRNTFVGTPCWMAPEVMEQLHGYDFKADIWSFGITALELAHGHAPFSKYPPMKVLLMTLQNAPPGLDYERDKRFSKSFKEMIAMCLVKDPTRRPSAEKLLKHSFFKHARSADYIARHLLEGLPPLGERVKSLKDKDAVRLAQKKMPYGEQEEKSQKEYQRGVSSWNFNVEDLKAQAALIQDDDEPAISKVPEEDEQSKPRSSRESDDSLEAASQAASSSPQPSVTRDSQMTTSASTLKPETATDVGDRASRSRTGQSSTALQSKSFPRSGPQLLGRKEPKHIGRFDVFEDDGNPGWHEPAKAQELRRTESSRDVRDASELRSLSDKDRRDDQKRDDRDEHRRPASGPLISDHVVASYRGREDDKDRDRDHRPSSRPGDEVRNAHHRERGSHSGPLTSSGAPIPDSRPATNGSSRPPPTAGIKEGPDEKPKGPVIQKKGRFSVVSDDVAMAEEVHHPSNRSKGSAQTGSLHKSASVGDWSSERRLFQLTQNSSFSQPPPLIPTNSSTVPVTAMIIQLQNIYNQGAVQQDLLLNAINSLSTGDAAAGQRLNHSSSKHFPRSSSISAGEYPMEVATERERELWHQLTELQNKLQILSDEMHNQKLRNVQLERQLNAIYNKEEEERIRREEAAKEDG